MGSTRLPGKVLRLLAGRSVLSHVVERVRACPRLDVVCVATSTASGDDAIVDECGRLSVTVVRGSEQDVLERFHDAWNVLGGDTIVRVTADCPLFDPDVLTHMIDEFVTMRGVGEKVDYLTNDSPPTFPRGLDAEVMTAQALETAHHAAKLPYEREHVTPYIYEHPELFVVRNHESPVELSSHRWTLDTEDDYRFMTAVFDELQTEGRIFLTEEILRLLERKPELVTG